MGRFTGERRALASAVLAFYAFLFLIIALAPPPGWGAAFGALAGVYGLAFFGIVAGYFWARWYAIGVGISGAISAVVSLWQLGMEPVLVFYGGTHLAASLFLWGGSMANLFDGQAKWREKFHLDDSSTHRLGRAVIRAGISLPYVVLYALAPREGADLTILFGALAACAGVWGLIKMRTWGLVAMAGGAIALLASLGDGAAYAATGTSGYSVDLTALGLGAGLLLIAAITPFVGPVVKYLRAG